MIERSVVAPAPTAFPEPPHLTDPSGAIAIWYTQPPGVVLQLTRPVHGTVSHAQWLAGPAREEMLRRFPHQELIVLFDVHLATGRDPAMRPIMLDVGRGLLGRAERVVVVLPRHLSPAIRSAMEVTLSILRVFGLPLEAASSLTYTLAATGLRPLDR
jgi:hypothetical protein